MAESEWYYSLNGQQQGPVSLQVLQDSIRAGQVSVNELAWKPGMANWLTVAEIPELAVAKAAPAPAAFSPQPFPPPPPYATQPFVPPGYAQAPQYGYPQQLGYGSTPVPSGKATTSFVLSLVGLFCTLCGGVVGIGLGVAAIVLGNQALSAMQASNNYQGRGLASAGKIIGIIDVVLGALIFLAMVGSRM